MYTLRFFTGIEWERERERWSEEKKGKDKENQEETLKERNVAKAFKLEKKAEE